MGNPFDRVGPKSKGPQPLLVTYNLSSRALTPGEPTPYVCMYVSMVCSMYVGMYWVRRESTQVHREGGTVSCDIEFSIETFIGKVYLDWPVLVVV